MKFRFVIEEERRILTLTAETDAEKEILKATDEYKMMSKHLNAGDYSNNYKNSLTIYLEKGGK